MVGNEKSAMFDESAGEPEETVPEPASIGSLRVLVCILVHAFLTDPTFPPSPRTSSPPEHALTNLAAPSLERTRQRVG